MNISDILIIVLFLAVALIGGFYYLNKKSMRKMVQTQEFIEQNRMTTQIFVIDKQHEIPSEKMLPKSVLDQLPKSVKSKKAYLVRAKIGPQIATLMCDKNVFAVLAVKKNVKVTIAGMYIISIVGMNLEDKKNKTFSEKIATNANKAMNKTEK